MDHDIFVCVLRVCVVVCVCRMRERQGDREWGAAGEGGCLASYGCGRYFHMNHIGVGVRCCLRALYQSVMWAFGVVCDAAVSCKIMIG